MARNQSRDAVEDYSAKRALLQELRLRLIADAPEETQIACAYLLSIEEDLTRLNFMLPERQRLVGRINELRAAGSAAKAAA